MNCNRLVSLGISCILCANLLGGCNSVQEQEDVIVPVESADTEFESADQAVKNMGIGWSLGNSLDSIGYIEGEDSTLETSWGNPLITPELIAAVKKAGFDAVRLPVTWYPAMDDSFQVSEDWMNRVAEVVDMILAEDMYCIVNVHHDTGTGDRWLRADPEAYEDISKQFTALWEQIASRFSDYDERLLFEGFNEITDKHSTQNEPAGTQEEKEAAYRVVNDLNQLFVDTVRNAGGANTNRNLICATYYGSITPEAIKHFVLPADSTANHLIAEVHCYCPYEFTFNDAKYGSLTEVFDENTVAVIDFISAGLKERFTDNNIPLILGEFGAMDKGNMEHRAAYAAYAVKKMEEIGAASFWWDNGKAEEFALFDRHEYTVIAPEIIESMMSSKTER